MPPFRTIALVLSVGLPGCTVGPDYKQPSVALADRYLGSVASQPRSAALPVRFDTWWEGFADPLLTRYVAQALAHNLDLAQAQAQVAQARAGLTLANAALAPSASVAGQAARAHQSIETPLGQVLDATPGYDRNGESYELNLDARWDLDLFGGLRRDREAALAQYQASAATAVATRLAVAAQTADVYTTLRGLQARLAIAQAQAKTQQDLLAKVALLNGKGLAAEYEVRQTEGELAQVEASIPVLQTGLDAAANALDVMLGSPPGTHRAELASTPTLPHPPRLTDIGTPAELLRRRPDLIAAEHRLMAANAAIGSAISEYYPRFSLGALIGSASTSGGTFFSAGAQQSSAFLGLRWRLFDFGRIDAEIDRAKGRETQALAYYRQSVLTASEEVENALSASLHRQIQAQRLAQGEASLERARHASFAAYRNGVASLIDVLNADRQLLQTSDARVMAEVETARAAIAVYKALGGGWSPSRRLADANIQ